jgi:hypothetical protein
MRQQSFRFCMLVGAVTLGFVAAYYFANYFVISIALGNNGLKPELREPIEALWLAFACHSLLIALLYLLVAFRPRAVSREVILIMGMLQLVEAGLLFSFSGTLLAAVLLTIAAVFVLFGAVLWPKLPAVGQAPGAGAAATSATG